MPINYLAYQMSGNLLVEEVRSSFYPHVYDSEFSYVDLLNMRFTSVEIISPNSKILGLYSSQNFI